MNVHRETQIRKEFDQGVDIGVTVVNNSEMIDSKIFNKASDYIEEVLDFINYQENNGNDVYC